MLTARSADRRPAVVEPPPAAPRPRRHRRLGAVWPYLLVGFVLFAYLKMPIIGVAILAVAIGFIMNTLQAKNGRSEASV